MRYFYALPKLPYGGFDAGFFCWFGFCFGFCLFVSFHFILFASQGMYCLTGEDEKLGFCHCNLRDDFCDRAQQSERADTVT